MQRMPFLMEPEPTARQDILSGIRRVAAGSGGAAKGEFRVGRLVSKPPSIGAGPVGRQMRNMSSRTDSNVRTVWC